MGILDSDSEGSDDGGYSSFEESFVVHEEKSKPKRRSSNDSTGSAKSVTEGTIEERLKAVMSLAGDLGVEKDPDIQEKEAKKEERQEERRRLASMSRDDRMNYQRSSSHDLMETIKMKRQKSLKMKGLDGASSHCRQNMQDVSGHSVDSTGMSDDEMDEFQKLKMKKKRATKKKKPVAKAAA